MIDTSGRGREIFGRSGSDGSDAAASLGVMLPVFGLLDGTIHPDRISEAARYGEAHGLDGLWLGDHLVHPLPLLESVVTLEHVATLTQHVRIGTSVMLLGLRKPIVIAKQLATIASYHPGRLSVGVGVGGEHPTEFAAAGVPLEERGARLEESVRQVRALWTGEQATEAGRFSDLRGVRIAPTPSAVPLVFGGHTPRALRRAAILGDAWVGFYKDVDGFAAARKTIETEREKAGLADEPFPTGMVFPTLLTDSDEGAADRAAEFMRGASTKDFQTSPEAFILSGTPERVLDRMSQYHSAGCEHFILAVLDQGDAYLDQMATVCEALLPGLRRIGGSGS